MSNKYIAVFVIALILVGGGAFYGGIQYDKSVAAKARVTARTQFGSGTGGNGQGGQSRRGMMGSRGQSGGDFVSGEILSKDDKSLTLKTADGGSTIVYFSDTANVRKAEIGNLSDLATGQQVTINGKSNSDGSIAADTVSIMPQIAK
ncbi:MAG: hypothetical protein WAW00_02855 [Candidatus Moraniibacteriota bacterium]